MRSRALLSGENAETKMIVVAKTAVIAALAIPMNWNTFIVSEYLSLISYLRCRAGWQLHGKSPTRYRTRRRRRKPRPAFRFGAGWIGTLYQNPFPTGARLLASVGVTAASLRKLGVQPNRGPGGIYEIGKLVNGLSIGTVANGVWAWSRIGLKSGVGQ